MDWLDKEIARLRADGVAHIWVAPERDELVHQVVEDGPLVAVNAYGSDQLRGDEPPEGWNELT
ncbi:MAG TPA: hypothetical protein VJT49_16640 [Amycolatopsis sp.]|uniref:hypothetical protein n=1 Tax=Amycolatopsis sp. TaxID=37632 RepID=UPI002B497815|nr:hypothetical protein [Amycolatopsis sp.]HKS46702.1 hypothetical protein [Amycolatopsis sp.]